jgi:hypothetical protein
MLQKDEKKQPVPFCPAKKIIVVTIVDIIGLGRYNLGNPIRNYSGALFLTG